MMMLGSTASAEEVSAEGLAVATAADDDRNVALNLMVQAAVKARRGQYDPARSDLERAIDHAAWVGDGFMLGQALLISADVEMACGRYDHARELIEAGIDAARETGSPFLSSAARMRAALDVVEGRAVHATAAFAGEEREHGGANMWLDYLCSRPAALVDAHVLVGDRVAARTTAEALSAASEAAGRLITAAHHQLALSRVDLADDDLASATTRAHAALKTFADAEAVAETLAALECVAACSGQRGEPQEAARLLAAAEEIRSSVGSVRSVTEQNLVQDALAAIEAALDVNELDSTRTEGRGLTLNAAVALARRGRGERNRPASGWDSLTPAERDVATRVAAGATNREVAQALFVSANTVKTHLSSVFAKLGVSSRTELARAMTKRGG